MTVSLKSFIEKLFICAFIVGCTLPFNVSAADLPGVIAKIKPSIVGVGTFLPTRRPPAKLLGTGFVVGDGSKIVTNHHVVDRYIDKEKRERLVIFAGQGKNPKIISANILKSDSKHDLALLSIKQKLPAMSLSVSSLKQEGEEFAFTGFPIGAILGLYPVTHRSIISSVTPIAIPAPSSQHLNANKIKRLRDPIFVYQLDATAYPGNSGSPLYDPESGEVVGIINMVHVKETKEDVLAKPSGISYAIPVKHLHKLIGSSK